MANNNPHPEWRIGQQVWVRDPMNPITGNYVLGIIASKGLKVAYIDIKQKSGEVLKNVNVPYNNLDYLSEESP